MQPDAAALGRRRAALEERLHQIGPNAGPLVLHGERGTPSVVLDAHERAAGPVAQRVLEQHVEHLPERAGRRVHGHRAARFDLEAPAGARVEDGPAVSVPAGESGKVEVHRLSRACLACVGEQVGHRAIEPVDLSERRGHLGALGLARYLKPDLLEP